MLRATTKIEAYHCRKNFQEKADLRSIALGRELEKVEGNTRSTPILEAGMKQKVSGMCKL